MLVKYIKNRKNQKIGVLVAKEKDKVGWSLCHKKDIFDKEKALRIAIGRADVGSNKEIPNSVFIDYNEFVDRAKRYYK